MRLWTVLNALVSKTKETTAAELETGAITTPRTIPPDVFNASVKGIIITDEELTELEQILGLEN